MRKYFILIILLYSCDNITSPKIEGDQGDGLPLEYAINIQGPNTGDNFDSYILKWKQYTNEDFQSYILKNGSEIIRTIEEPQDTMLIREINPGTFEKIHIDMMAETTEKDSIEIYTRPIKPITDLSVVANADNWFSTLNWTPSQEISTSFEKYNIYRSDVNLDNFIFIDEITTQNTQSYVDTNTTWGYEYYYKIETYTIEEYSRHSIIQSNITNNIGNHEINYFNATNNQYNKIDLNWVYDINEQEFYAMEIWRTNIQSEDPLNGNLLATITDYNKNSLEDSYLIGNGLSWFYKLKLVDQFGNINYSPTVVGNALP